MLILNQQNYDMQIQMRMNVNVNVNTNAYFMRTFYEQSDKLILSFSFLFIVPFFSFQFIFFCAVDCYSNSLNSLFSSSI